MSRIISKPVRVADTISPKDISLKSNMAPRSGRITTISFAFTCPRRTSSSTSAAYMGFWLTTRKSPGLNKSSAVRDTSIFGASGISDPSPGSTVNPFNFADASPEISKFRKELLNSLKVKRVSPLFSSSGLRSSVTATSAPMCRPDPVPTPPAVALSMPSCRPTSRSATSSATPAVRETFSIPRENTPSRRTYPEFSKVSSTRRSRATTCSPRYPTTSYFSPPNSSV